MQTPFEELLTNSKELGYKIHALNYSNESNASKSLKELAKSSNGVFINFSKDSNKNIQYCNTVAKKINIIAYRT